MSPTKGFPYFGGFPSASDSRSHHGSPPFNNEFVERASPLQKDYLNRKWDSFIESPPLKRIEFASSASPSPMRTVSQTEGHPLPNGWNSQQDGHPLSSRDFWSQKQRGILRLHKWSVERGTPIKKGLIVPLHIKVA